MERHFQDLINGKTNIQLRVQDYADLQSLHVNYLSSVISSKTGKTVGSWIADKVINGGEGDASGRKISIKEVANRLGFLEAPHFSNYFKKHTSVSPAEYRKQYLRNPFLEICNTCYNPCTH